MDMLRLGQVAPTGCLELEESGVGEMNMDDQFRIIGQQLNG
jgi:hypothetical protein